MTTSSYTTEAQEIRNYVNDEFDRAPVQFPNMPEGENGFEKPSDSEWVRMFINDADAFAVDIANNPRHRHTGVVTFQVLVPAGTGDGLARELADELAGLFRQISVGTIKFLTPSVQPIGLSDDNSFYQMNVVCPFERDTINFDN